MLCAIAAVPASLAHARAPGSPSAQTPDASPATDLISRLEQLDQTAGDSDISRDARAQAAQTADTLRAKLIELLPDHDRAPSWIVDRAAFTLAKLSETDADLAALVGLPTTEQRLRVAQNAQSALQLLRRAQTAAGGAIARLEADVLARPASATEAERSLSRLVDVEQSQRIPLLTAISHALIAASAIADSDKASSATSAVRALDHIRVRSARLEASRDTVAALAVLNASQALSDRGVEAVRGKLNAALIAKETEPATAARARLALLAVGVGEPSAPDAPWSMRLIEHEARLRAKLRTPGSGTRARVTLLAGPALDLINLTVEPVLPADRAGLSEAAVRDARRALIYAKLAPVIDTLASPASLASELVFARAVTMLRESDRNAAAAAPLLEHVAQRIDATADLRADAYWELAAACDKQPGQGEKSVRALHALISTLPSSGRATDAALTLTDRLAPDFSALAGSMRDPETQTPPAPVRAEYLDAVRLLAKTPGQSRFAADLVRAELFADASRVSAEAFRAALRAFDQLPNGPPRAAANAAIILSLPKLASALPTIPDAERAALVKQAIDFVRVQSPDHTGAASLVFGEALVPLGRAPAAVALLTEALNSPIDVPGSAEAARIRLALASALRQTGAPDQAAQHLRDLASQFERAAGESGRDPAYWAAWCELLELSVLNEHTPERLTELRVHLSRLELIDPALGGPPLAPRFTKLKAIAATPPPPSLAPQNPANPQAASPAP